MLRIRRFEECIADCVAEGEIRTPCHLYIGQEAVAVGACSVLEDRDYLFSNYRGHGHFLAKGGNSRTMLAEVFCRASGCSAGRGGSMHLVAPEIGIMGNTAIVSGHISLAAGAALSCRREHEGRVAVVFFGDAAAEEGVFSEVINYTALKKLPLVMICENNLYAAHMPLRERQPLDRLAVRAEPYMPSMSIDGNDVIQVHTAMGEAVERARADAGPSFVECMTYRWRGHVGPNLDLDKGIRERDELEAWMQRCPIQRLQNILSERSDLPSGFFEEVEPMVAEEVSDALEYAKAEPRPRAETLLDNVYAGAIVDRREEAEHE